jgi:2-isopropylmalate synthase
MGNNSLGFALRPDQKLEIAQQLVKLGVDIIEAGFPASSPGDFNSVQEISKKMKGVAVAAWHDVLKKILICVLQHCKKPNPRW